MKLFGKIICMVILAMAMGACKKTPGQGGNASVKGSVWVKKYDTYFTVLQYEYPGADIKVELTFGDNTSPDLVENSNSNGDFEFLYLRQGKYKVTVYSDVLQNAQNPSGKIPVESIVEITSANGSVSAGMLTIQKNK